MVAAYSYIRFSTPALVRGDSLRRQLSKAEKFCDENGLILDTSMRDKGVSAFKGKHRKKGALAGFLAKIEGGEIAAGSFFIVENIDRLSRENSWDALGTVREIIEAGITIASLVDDMIYNRETLTKRPDTMLVLQAALTKGNRESADKGDRLQEAWGNKREEIRAGGRKKLTRQGPAWLDLMPDDPAEPLVGDWRFNDRAGDVRRCFELALAGLGRELIARAMADAGVRPLKHGDGWHASTVLTLLRDRRVLGELQLFTKRDGVRTPSGDPIIGYFTPLIDETTFYAVQTALRARWSGATPATNGKVPNVFRGIARCACGRVMEYRDKTGPRNRGASNIYLICSGARRSERLCDHDHHFIYRDLETAVLRWITDIRVTDEQANAATIAGMKLGAKEAELVDLEARVAKGLDAYDRETDAMLADALLSRVRTNTSRMASLKLEIEELASEVRYTKRDAIDDKRAVVKRAAETVAGLEGEALFAARGKLAAAVRDVIERMEFSAGDVMAYLKGGKKAYGFRAAAGSIYRVPEGSTKAIADILAEEPCNEVAGGKPVSAAEIALLSS